MYWNLMNLVLACRDRPRFLVGAICNTLAHRELTTNRITDSHFFLVGLPLVKISFLPAPSLVRCNPTSYASSLYRRNSRTLRRCRVSRARKNPALFSTPNDKSPRRGRDSKRPHLYEIIALSYRIIYSPRDSSFENEFFFGTTRSVNETCSHPLSFVGNHNKHVKRAC